MPVSNKNDFSEWLRNRGSSESTLEKYVSSIEGSLSNWAAIHDVYASGIFDIQNSATFAEVSNRLRELQVFKERNITGHGMYGAALNRYSEFLASVEPGKLVSEAEDREAHESAVKRALSTPAKERAKRMKEYGEVPRTYEVRTIAFDRNPYVVAEVLIRANGVCERCGKAAPFNRRSDQTPYLEVHHRKPLAQGGLDVVANAIGLCPNCHQEAHFG